MLSFLSFNGIRGTPWKRRFKIKLNCKFNLQIANCLVQFQGYPAKIHTGNSWIWKMPGSRGPLQREAKSLDGMGRQATGINIKKNYHEYYGAHLLTITESKLKWDKVTRQFSSCCRKSVHACDSSFLFFALNMFTHYN